MSIGSNMEPISIGVTAIEFAAGQIKGLLDEAAKRREEDIRGVLLYLQAARQAVYELENECDRILGEARVCDFSQAEQCRTLLNTIEAYLHQERIRPHLETAIRALHRRQEMLRDRSERIFQFPWRQPDRHAAVEHFSDLLSKFVAYLEFLASSNFNTPSGPQWERIDRIRKLLEQSRDGVLQPGVAHSQAVAIVDQARSDPSKGGWRDLMTQVEDVTYDLRAAFR